MVAHSKASISTPNSMPGRGRQNLTGKNTKVNSKDIRQLVESKEDVKSRRCSSTCQVQDIKWS
jgi:hypothetical protein